jgi:hypothetical protein
MNEKLMGIIPMGKNLVRNKSQISKKVDERPMKKESISILRVVTMYI